MQLNGLWRHKLSYLQAKPVFLANNLEFFVSFNFPNFPSKSFLNLFSELLTLKISLSLICFSYKLEKHFRVINSPS